MLFDTYYAPANKLEALGIVDKEQIRKQRQEADSQLQKEIFRESPSNFSSQQQHAFKESKYTNSTDSSERDCNESFSFAKDQELNWIDVTFNNFSQSQRETITQNKKYTHESAQTVLLYSLLFNHFHLKTQQDNLPLITQINSRFVSVFKAALSHWQHLTQKLGMNSSFSPENLIELLEDDSSESDQRPLLKQIMDKLNEESAHLLMKAMTQRQKKSQMGSKDKEKRKRGSQKQNYQRSPKLTVSEKEIEDFAEAFNIRIKLIDRLEVKQLGRSSSLIWISVKKSRSDLFSLKNISCFEESN